MLGHFGAYEVALRANRRKGDCATRPLNLASCSSVVWSIQAATPGSALAPYRII